LPIADTTFIDRAPLLAAVIAVVGLHTFAASRRVSPGGIVGVVAGAVGCALGKVYSRMVNGSGEPPPLELISGAVLEVACEAEPAAVAIAGPFRGVAEALEKGGREGSGGREGEESEEGEECRQEGEEARRARERRETGRQGRVRECAEALIIADSASLLGTDGRLGAPSRHKYVRGHQLRKHSSDLVEVPIRLAVARVDLRGQARLSRVKGWSSAGASTAKQMQFRARS